jgi:hypothetical protein
MWIASRSRRNDGAEFLATDYGRGEFVLSAVVERPDGDVVES